MLRDIKKWIRFYDQKLNRMDVARCLAETNLVGGDLLAILATWNENATLQRFRARIALACYEILTPLTWPLEKDLETMTVNHHRHLPVLQLSQVAYKRAIINYDGAQILHTAVRAALPSMAVPLGDRSLRDQGVIKLVLFFLRNVVMIEPPPGVQYDGDESQISRSATIDAFSYQDIFLVLLTIASNMGEDFRTEDTTVMEILFHLVKRVDTAKLFMDETQLNHTKASELTDMMKKETAMLQSFNKNGPTRHSRFGTMVWVDRGEGKMSALSGQDALMSAAARERKMDSSKKFRPPRRGRKRDEKQELVGLGAPVSLNARANGQLRKFVEEFLDAGFNPLFQHIRKSIDREAPHVQHHHRAQFFYLVSWFLEAERMRQKAQKARRSQKKAQPTPTPIDEVNSFNLVAGVLNQEMFIFLGRALDRSNNDKDWPELTVVMRCFTQILLTVQEMSESKNEDDEEIAENILSRLFYEETTHDAITNIVKNFKDQGYEYLDACTELTHTYLRILEAYSKQNVDLQVRSRRRTRKKKKAAKVAAATGAANGDAAANGGGDEENLIPDAQNDDDDESGDDEAAAQKTSTERSFDFKRFASRFAVQPIIDTFVKFLNNYRDLSDAQLKRAHRFFYRVAFKQDMSVMLFRVDIIRLLFNMVKGPEPLDRQNAMYRDWEELSKQILRKCTKKIEERPVLIIEMLFSKTAGTAHFLEYGYEKQTVSSSAPKPGGQLEFREQLDKDRQIAILVGVLLDKNHHDLLNWIKNQAGMAAAERRAWKAAETAIVAEAAAAAASAAAAATTESNASNTPDEPPAPPVVTHDAPTISIRPSDDACKKAMFKNSHLRLLMNLVGMERLAPSVDETLDSTWIIASRVTADELEESLELINRAEFDPPTFDHDQSAEDQLKRKTALRKKAAYDDDDDDNNNGLDVGDEALFPAGGPTARKVVEDGLDGRKKKTIRRRQKKTDDDGNEVDGPTEIELDERSRLRREKELEKARRIKSDVYVHASDDETDDEKDREFFAREEATRSRIHNAVQESLRSSKGDDVDSDSLPAAPNKPTKAKRKSTVLSDDDDDLDNNSDDDLVSSQDLPASGRRSRKRRKSSEEASGTEDDDGDAEDEDEDEVVVEKKAPPKRRQQAGFVDSSDEEDDDDVDIDKGAAAKDPVASQSGDAMDLDDPSPAVLAEKTGGQIQLNGNSNADGENDVDDDDDDDIPVASKKRTARAKSGFLADSDDE